jgi:hypothetical protein
MHTINSIYRQNASLSITTLGAQLRESSCEKLSPLPITSDICVSRVKTISLKTAYSGAKA